MTLIDAQDLRDRTCPKCGAVIWDRPAHDRWHRALSATFEALWEGVRDLTDPFIIEEDTAP